MQPKIHKKTNSRGSTLAIYKTVLIIFPLNLQTITITLDVKMEVRGH